MTIANSVHTCRIMGFLWKPRFHELEHEWKMRLLKTHSHTSERQGYEADKGTPKDEIKEEKTYPQGQINKPSTKAVAIPQVGRKVSAGERKDSTKKKKNGTFYNMIRIPEAFYDRGSPSLKELHTAPENGLQQKSNCIPTNNLVAQVYRNVIFSKQDRHSDSLGLRNPVIQEAF